MHKTAASPFLSLVLCSLLLVADEAAGADYLYHGFNDTEPVIDLVVNSTRYEYPSFLNYTGNGPRVVEFYAPWCPHCRHFKSTYVRLARDVASTREGARVKFYAVSCTAHNAICQDQGVRGYPSVRAFRSGEDTGEKLDHGHLEVDLLLTKLGIRSAVREKTDTKQNETAREEGGNAEKTKVAPTEDERTAAAYERTKADVFRDASLSLDFSFRNAIFMARGPLSSDRKDALREWIDLLNWVLPMDMTQSHKQIDALRRRFDSISRSEDALEEAIFRIEPDKNEWSLSCTHGSPHKGYTCGLWELFHIVTVGVAELSGEQSSDRKASALHAAGVLRNFVQHFFGCIECRENFIKMYDECMFDRCDRLSADDASPENIRRELPLWLWQAHNSVNVRLLHERAKRDGGPVPTAKQDQAVRWPDRAACPRCWNDDGSWDKDAVYTFLRTEYWPFLVKPRAKLRQKIRHYVMTHEGEFVDASVAMLSRSFVWPLAALSAGGIIWALRQKHQKDLIGRSKKIDASHHNHVPI